VCKTWIKNSQPFGKNVTRQPLGDFRSHCNAQLFTEMFTNMHCSVGDKQAIHHSITPHGVVGRRTTISWILSRVRPKFGFGYGAETDLTYGFGLVSATAKVQWHEFGFGRNITPQRRNCKIGANCNTVAVGQLGYSLWEDKAALMLAGIDDPKLDTTASHPSSLSHSLPRRVVCHPGQPARTIMGGLVPRLQRPCLVYFYCRYPLVGGRFRFRLRLRP